MPLLATVHYLVNVGVLGSLCSLSSLCELPVQGGGEVAQDLDLEESGVAGKVPVNGSRVLGHRIVGVAPDDVWVVARGEPVTPAEAALHRMQSPW